LDAVILDGERQGEDLVAPVQAVVSSEFAKRGWDVHTFHLRDRDIGACSGCFGCWERTPGECLGHDDAQEITRAFVQSDVAVFLTAVTFGGYSSELKKALDRSICIVSPFFASIEGETRHRKRYDRYPSMLALGVAVQEDAEAEALFKELVRRNALNMHSPKYAVQVLRAGESAEVVRAAILPLLDTLGVVA